MSKARDLIASWPRGRSCISLREMRDGSQQWALDTHQGALFYSGAWTRAEMQAQIDEIRENREYHADQEWMTDEWRRLKNAKPSEDLTLFFWRGGRSRE